MKMTTEIPPGITTSDEVKTRLGTLNFFDGVPDKETVQKVYKFLDFQHAFQAYMSGIQIASMDAIRKGLLEFGPANTNYCKWSKQWGQITPLPGNQIE